MPEDRRVHQTGNCGRNRKDQKWPGHNRRRFMRVVRMRRGFLVTRAMLRFGAAAVLAVEGEEDRSEHIERRQSGSDEGDNEEVLFVAPCFAEDLVLAPEPGEWRYSGQAEAAEDKRPI